MMYHVRSLNNADGSRDRTRRVRLSGADVEYIRALAARRIKQATIGRMFGVKQGEISTYMLLHGINPGRNIPEALLPEILARVAAGATVCGLAREYGYSPHGLLTYLNRHGYVSRRGKGISHHGDAIRDMLSQGMKKCDIAERLGLRPRAVYRYVAGLRGWRRKSRAGAGATSAGGTDAAPTDAPPL